MCADEEIREILFLPKQIRDDDGTLEQARAFAADSLPISSLHHQSCFEPCCSSPTPLPICLAVASPSLLCLVAAQHPPLPTLLCALLLLTNPPLCLAASSVPCCFSPTLLVVLLLTNPPLSACFSQVEKVLRQLDDDDSNLISFEAFSKASVTPQPSLCLAPHPPFSVPPLRLVPPSVTLLDCLPLIGSLVSSPSTTCVPHLPFSFLPSLVSLILSPSHPSPQVFSSGKRRRRNKGGGEAAGGGKPADAAKAAEKAEAARKAKELAAQKKAEAAAQRKEKALEIARIKREEALAARAAEERAAKVRGARLWRYGARVDAGGNLGKLVCQYCYVVLQWCSP